MDDKTDGEQKKTSANGMKRLTQSELDEIVTHHEMRLTSKSTGTAVQLQRLDLSGLSFKKRRLSHANFSGSLLVGADFEDATLDFCVFFACDLRETNFRNASMVRVDLRGACMRGAIMTGADMSGADMREGKFATYDPDQGLNFVHEKKEWIDGVGGADMRGANMDSVKMAGAVAINSNFEDANLTKAKLVRGDLTGANMQGSNLSGADFSSCALRNVNMRESNLTGTIINFSEMENVDMTDALTEKAVGRHFRKLSLPLEDLVKLHQIWIRTHGEDGRRLDLSGFDLRGAPSLTGSDLTMLLANRSVWYGQDFIRVNLQAAQLRDSDFRNCNFSSADLRGSDFSGSKMTGANLTHVRFEPLVLDGDRLLKTKFKGATLRYADFTKADLRQVVFADADLSNADFTGADIVGADFSGAKLDEAKIDLSQINR